MHLPPPAQPRLFQFLIVRLKFDRLVLYRFLYEVSIPYSTIKMMYDLPVLGSRFSFNSL